MLTMLRREKHRKERGWGHISVTDLVPVWCESQFVYRLSSLSHLPPALRPTALTNPETGAVIPIDLEKNIERDAVLKKGTAVHAVLEKETMGEEVKVVTTGEEEKMALRVVRLLVGLDVLLRTGITVRVLSTTRLIDSLADGASFTARIAGHWLLVRFPRAGSD